jgi:UDP-glucose 4-epimerase
METMKTVLITGAHGFLGRYCAAEFASNGYRVIGIGHGAWSAAEAAAAGVDLWFERDVSLTALAELPGCPDAIVHAAGSGSVSFSLSRPREDFERSVETTLALLEYARLADGAPHLVLLSSAAVYGCAGAEPLAVDVPSHPTSPYGVHKNLAEQLCASYRDHFGVASSVIRFFSVYGPGLKKQLLWEACSRMSAAPSRNILEFFGSGAETRDWLHAVYAARLVRMVAEHHQGGLVVNGWTVLQNSFSLGHLLPLANITNGILLARITPPTN